jgi:uncharacterized protein (TIGR00297 family)
VRNRPQYDRLHWQSTAILSLVLSLASIYVLFTALWAATTRVFQYGLLACCALAIVAVFLRAVTPFAAATGTVLSFSLFLSTLASNRPWARTPLVPLLTLFVLTYIATRFRREHKSKLGQAESKRGRNAAQVAANIGVASLVVPVLMSPNWLLQSSHGWLIARVAVFPAMVAALAEAAADTVSSEIGQAVGGEPKMLTTWREVPAGTDGAISAKGTIAGLAAALLIVLVSMKVLQLPSRVGILALGGAVFGLFFDSLLGATLERRGLINNDAVNFLSTLAAAVFAGSAAWIAASMSR